MTVQWLTEEQLIAWRAYLENSQRVRDKIEQDLMTDTGIDFAEYEILVRLSEAKDRSIRMAKLARQVVHSPSRLNYTVKKMQEKNWVERKKCPGDKRGILAVLTDLGFKELKKAAPKHVACVQEVVIAKLTPRDLNNLGKIMEKLGKNL